MKSLLEIEVAQAEKANHLSSFPLEKPEEKEDEEKKEEKDKDPWWKPKDTEENLSRGTVFFFLTHVYRIPASTEDNRFIFYSLFERLSSYLYSEQVLEITLNGCPTRRDSRKLKTGLLRHICCKAFREDRTHGIVALSNV